MMSYNEDPTSTVDVSPISSTDLPTNPPAPLVPAAPRSSLEALAYKYKDNPSLLFDNNCYTDLPILLSNLDKLVSIFPVRDKYKCKEGESEIFIYSKKPGLIKNMEGCTRAINFSGNRELCGNPESSEKIISNWLDRQKFGQDNAQCDARRFMLGRVVSRAEYTLVAVKWDSTLSMEKRIVELEQFKVTAVNLIAVLGNFAEQFKQTLDHHSQILAHEYPNHFTYSNAPQPNFTSTHGDHLHVTYPFLPALHAENLPNTPFLSNHIDMHPLHNDTTTTTTSDMDFTQQPHPTPNPSVNPDIVFTYTPFPSHASLPPVAAIAKSTNKPTSEDS